MLTERDTIRCEAVFSDNHKHRYLWKRVWDKSKPLAAVIMLNPCMADTLTMDTTTFLVVNNVVRLEEFGGVEIVNLFSMLTDKLNFRWYEDTELNGPDNDGYIRRAAAECETVVLAWGRTQDTNQHIADRVMAVLKLLDDCKDKLRVISDGRRSGIHPLTPSIRAEWILETFQRPRSIGPAAKKAERERAAEKAKRAERADKPDKSGTGKPDTGKTDKSGTEKPDTPDTDKANKNGTNESNPRTHPANDTEEYPGDADSDAAENNAN